VKQYLVKAKEGTVFPVSVAMRAAVPAAVCPWGLCPGNPGVGVGRCLSEVDRSSSPSQGLASTRYFFTPKLYCGSPSSFYCPPWPANPTLLQYYCTTIAQYTPPPAPTPPSYAIQHTILVLAISCKGQPKVQNKESRGCGVEGAGCTVESTEGVSQSLPAR